MSGSSGSGDEGAMDSCGGTIDSNSKLIYSASWTSNEDYDLSVTIFDYRKSYIDLIDFIKPNSHYGADFVTTDDRGNDPNAVKQEVIEFDLPLLRQNNISFILLNIYNYQQNQIGMQQDENLKLIIEQSNIICSNTPNTAANGHIFAVI